MAPGVGSATATATTGFKGLLDDQAKRQRLRGRDDGMPLRGGCGEFPETVAGA